VNSCFPGPATCSFFIKNKVDEATRKSIEDALEELKKAIDGGDVATITEAEQKLAEKAQKLGEVIYQQTQQEQASSGASGGDAEAPKDAEVVDAEVVDENDRG